MRHLRAVVKALPRAPRAAAGHLVYLAGVLSGAVQWWAGGRAGACHGRRPQR